MRAMLFLLVCLTVPAYGQSTLPPCVLSWTNCQGTYTYNATGNIYVGEIRDGKRHGQGTYTFANGDKYVGEHRDGKFNGQGILTLANGNKYVGEFRDDWTNGQGTYTFANGNKYVGEFRDGKYQGQGSLIYADGRPPLEGVWEDSKFVRKQRIPDHIAGRTSTPPLAQAPRRAEPPRSTLSLSASAYGQSALPPCNPNVSFTRWTNCQGTYTRANGNNYVGEFRDGTYNGQGIYTYANGAKYVGEWRDDKFNGQGTFTYVSGDKYVGEFRDGWSHGQGILIYADGRPPKEGVWEDNKFVRAERITDHIAGRTSTPPVAQAPRQAEPPRPTLSLYASASQPDPNGVVTLTITTNSDTASLKINGDEAGGRADGRYALKRFAQVGENRFEVVATDRFGNTQRQTVSVAREFVQTAPTIPVLNPLSVQAVKQRDAVAIVIGIEKYRSVPAADFANRDASIFVDYATRALGIPRENIRLLLDDKAGAAEILLTFKNWLPTRIKRGSTDVYVFYSGHGLPSEDGRSLFLLPHEANRDLLERTAISQNELVAAIQKSSPKSVTMFIDSCYSGQSRTGETLLASARPISVKAKQSSFPSNFTVISASAPDQISSSSPELKHGIFSYYLMRGMEGEADANGDKQITVGEMQTYLSEKVTRRAMGMNRTQQPQVVGDTSRVLVGR